MEHWVLIADDVLVELLRRAHAGEGPDVLLAEAWANAKHTTPDEIETDESHAHLTDGGIVVISCEP